MYNGLNSEEVVVRQNQGLVNSENIRYSRSVKDIVISNVFTFFNLIIFTLAILVSLTGSYRNMLFIVVALINTVIAIYQELKAKIIIDKLTIATIGKTRVIRNNEIVEINQDEIVLDDLIILRSGDSVVVDCDIISSDVCEVDESIITGESNSIIKRVGDKIFSGTIILSGSCKAKVVSVGVNNYASKLIMKATSINETHSYLRKNLNNVLKIITYIVLPLSILLFISQYFFSDLTFNQAILSTVAGVIGMIPSGLMLLTSVAMAVGVIKMAKERVVIQEITGIETLACVDVLCLDKTGTITDGTLEVIDTVVMNNEFDIENVIANMLDTYLVNATDMALSKYFHSKNKYDIVKKIPFSSIRKYSAVTFNNIGTFALGALEYIIKDKNEIKKCEKFVDDFLNKGYRVITLAHSKDGTDDQKLSSNMRVIGFIILKDNIRKNAKETINYFEEQGVELKIISGDNPKTISNTLKQVGFSNCEKYIDANELPNKYSELIKVINNYTIFGRTTPLQKQRIIKALKHKKSVGMIGDGVNDILALREADASIALNSGSDAAKSVSQVILVDSDFRILPDIVMEGRRVVNNIERVSSLYLIKTIYSILISIITIFTSVAYPFYPIQLTLISSVCVGAPSFVLALEANNNKVDKKFLYNIFKNSVPGGVCVVFNICFILLMCYLFNVEFDNYQIIVVSLTGLINVLILYKICVPLTMIRKLILILVLSTFLGLLIFQADLFLLIGFNYWTFGVSIALFILNIIIIRMLDKLYEKYYKKVSDFKFIKKIVGGK